MSQIIKVTKEKVAELLVDAKKSNDQLEQAGDKVIESLNGLFNVLIAISPEMAIEFIGKLHESTPQIAAYLDSTEEVAKHNYERALELVVLSED